MSRCAKISVIVPCHNAQRHIRVCLESLKAQKEPEIEMILIDDGSTDATGAILDQFARTEQRARVIHTLNAGVSAARNRGIEAATGRYIAFVDADDALEEGSFAALYQTALRTGAQIVSANHVLFDEAQGMRVGVDTEPVVQQPSEIVKEIIHMHRIYNNIWNKLYIRELFSPDVRLDERVRIGEDALLNLQLYLRARRVAHLAECTYVYRVHNGSAMANIAGYSEAHQPMLRGMNELLLREAAKERYFRDFLQICVWIEEKERGIRAAMRQFDDHVRALVLGGIDVSKLAKSDVKLYSCVKNGWFPLYYIAQRILEKLTRRKWGIRR